MKPYFREKLLALLVLPVVLCSAQAQAGDVGALGNERGGGPFRIACEPGDPVVGFDIWFTHVVQKIAPICGNTKTRAGTYGRPTAGQASGNPTAHMECPPGGVLTILHVFTDKTPLVSGVGFTCWTAATAKNTDHPPPSTGLAVKNQRFLCPRGEMGIGIYGRAGTAIDQLGLTCGPIAPASGGHLTAEQQALLDAHNAYRAKHCVPALTWSDQAAAAAAQWASGCQQDSQGRFVHESQDVYGENLAWGAGLSGHAAVDLWYNEINNYNFAAPVYTDNPQVGHFTQLVWRTTTQVGCAMKVCNGQNFWVCRYLPPGNWNVKPGPKNPSLTAQQAQQNLMANVPKPCH